MPAQFTKHIQFSKLEETAGGERLVWGIATLEAPDLDREICRYKSAVAVYRDWSNAMLARTTKAGQDPSLGNVRLQHGLEIGGKVTKIEYDDDAKRIMLGSVPLNDEIHRQLKEGFYTGYSQGGSYACRECSECGAAMPMQQAANFCKKCQKEVDVYYDLESLSEVSYVDSPCTGEGFDSVKADGSKATIKFRRATMPNINKDAAKTKRVGGKDLPAACFAYVGDAEKATTWKLPIAAPDKDAEWEKRQICNALCRCDHTKGVPADKKDEVKAKIVAAAKIHEIDVEAEAAKTATARAKVAEIVEKRATAKGLEKGMYTIGRFADIIQSLEYLYMDTMYEAEYEGDESPVPAEISDDMESLIETFLALVEEETNELTAAHKKFVKGTGIPNNKENNMSEELMKAAKKSLARHFGKAAAHHTKIAKVYAAKAEEHDGLHEIHKAHVSLHEEACKVHKAVGVDGAEENGNDFHEKMAEHHAEKVKLHKKEAEAHKGLAEESRKAAKAHEDHAEHCKAVAEEHDKEEAEKTAKEAGAAVANPVVKTAPAITESTQSEFERNAIAKAQESLMKDPDFLEEVKRRERETLLNKLASAGADAALAHTPEPTAVKTASPTLVPRAGQNFDFAKEAPRRDNDCGL